MLPFFRSKSFVRVLQKRPEEHFRRFRKFKLMLGFNREPSDNKHYCLPIALTGRFWDRLLVRRSDIYIEQFNENHKTFPTFLDDWKPRILPPTAEVRYTYNSNLTRGNLTVSMGQTTVAYPNTVVYFKCPVKGFPPPTVTWEKGDTKGSKGEVSVLIFNLTLKTSQFSCPPPQYFI